MSYSLKTLLLAIIPVALLLAVFNWNYSASAIDRQLVNQGCQTMRSYRVGLPSFLQHIVGLHLVTDISDVWLFELKSKSPIKLDAELVKTIDQLPDNVVLWVYDAGPNRAIFADACATFPTKTVRNIPAENVSPNFGVTGSWFGIKQSSILLVTSIMACLALSRLHKMGSGSSVDAV